MSALATLDDLKGRLDWTLDADEERVATAALDDASAYARAYGKESWESDTAPQLVKTLVITACVRFLRNPDGFTVSRAGDETVQWSDKDHEMGTVHFTDKEIKLLEAMAGKVNFGSNPLTAWGTNLRKREGYVPVDYVGGKRFPMFPSDEGPW